MAKRIKPIKCPQCGSTQATEAKTDYYRCNSCQSEFFIDSDDININHRHIYNTVELPPVNKKYLVMSTIISFAFLIGVIVFYTFIQKNSYPLSSTLQKNTEYWGIEAIIPTADKEGEPIAVAVGDIVSGNYPNQTYKPTFGFFHAKTFKEIATVPIDIEQVGQVRWKKMDEGKTYIVINKNRLFLLDENTLSINEVTPQTIGLPEFEKGFAEIDTNSFYENSLEITNNLGKEYYYFPKLNKAVSEKDYNESEDIISKNPVNPKEITRFCFSSKSVAYEKELEDKHPELFKVKTASEEGYPYRKLYFRWIYNYSLKKAEFVTGKEESKVISYENFTPERIYFKPEVLHYDDKEVLIYFKHDVAESSPYFFQVLDAQTGEVKFTLQSNKDITYLNSSEVAKIKEGYLIGRYDAYILNTKEGKLEKSELREKLTQR